MIKYAEKQGVIHCRTCRWLVDIEKTLLVNKPWHVLLNGFRIGSKTLGKLLRQQHFFDKLTKNFQTETSQISGEW